ncbi:hypothetical protein [Stenotrophomonas panacihumi]|uniref:hypothetical protein n=1 Tax=Stenotrophomonas panacihumi TaxID=676599 RepID=UPI0009D6DC8E|nr:hypothetical protein [Stenotrophomonas panacihumi]PTN55051.1 hypothetical protein C9J98_07580 [Stenotrophomonas panacihumi]
MKRDRDFSARAPLDQAFVLQNTWCDICQEADIGLANPTEYEEDGRVFVEGACARCGNGIVTELSAL